MEIEVDNSQLYFSVSDKSQVTIYPSYSHDLPMFRNLAVLESQVRLGPFPIISDISPVSGQTMDYISSPELEALLKLDVISFLNIKYSIKFRIATDN